MTQQQEIVNLKITLRELAEASKSHVTLSPLSTRTDGKKRLMDAISNAEKILM